MVPENPLVTALPNESSTVTTGWPAKTLVALELAEPEGSVVNWSCVGAPYLVTAKVLLVAGTAGADPVAETLIVYGVASVTFEIGL
jgi:hypothetical protein